MFAGGAAEPVPERGVGERPAQGGGQGGGIADRHEQAGLAVGDDLDGAAGGGRHDGPAGGGRLEQGVRQALRDGGLDDEVEGGIEAPGIGDGARQVDDAGQVESRHESLELGRRGPSPTST